MDIYSCILLILYILQNLERARYEYKYIVDGNWKFDPEAPKINNGGNTNNVIDLTDYKPKKEIIIGISYAFILFMCRPK